ncbi:hypothetical protein FH972_003571 [Carpinus fangiana]|uniref:FHA domain-containing protein n=1 Tax=Carpinus fangiana TaxID=176857 RepID=A0A5N6QKS4_9ROSI|nr:hypothetical protein FH972_003571 [Carpinus fangiana]
MELEYKDGSRIALQDGQKTVFGRGSGFHTDDRTVSRRHVLLGAKTSGDKSGSQTGPKVSFEVVGKNPIWVRESGGGEIRVFRRGEKGDAAPGDWLCFSGRTPAWFTVRGSGFGEGEKRVLGSENGMDANLRSGLEFDGAGVSEIDPVKEFGFLVMGHEFDHYPKQMIRDIKNWDWFLEERRRDSDDDDDEYLRKRGKRGLMRKRKKAEGNDDDDWTSESDDDKELVAKLRKVEKPKYSTRSKDSDKLDKEAEARKNSSQKKTRGANKEYVENKNENDETLGGFIVVDDDVEQGEEIDEDEEEEEEEFIEDDDDDEEELDD